MTHPVKREWGIGREMMRREEISPRIGQSGARDEKERRHGTLHYSHYRADVWDKRVQGINKRLGLRLRVRGKMLQVTRCLTAQLPKD